eukprot:TRINITY_DN74835_c0_g1_i1.p1 TRINITY_DN74835_c0_g1~~TRINITY_DN74835_c0_g1_i1.p1  ORF type:complete len:306 (-),score=32.01 TRINITY_DN74835_c0_g1_i1:75-932(-)
MIPARRMLICLCVYWGFYAVSASFLPTELLSSYGFNGGVPKHEAFILLSYFFVLGFLSWMLVGAWVAAARMAGTRGQSWVLLLTALSIAVFTFRSFYFMFFGQYSTTNGLYSVKRGLVVNFVMNSILVIGCLLATDFKQLHAKCDRTPLYWGFYLGIIYSILNTPWGDINQVPMARLWGFVNDDFSDPVVLAMYKSLSDDAGSLYLGVAFISLAVVLAGDHRWTWAVSRWFAAVNLIVIGNNIASAAHAKELGFGDAYTQFCSKNIVNAVFVGLYCLPSIPKEKE